MNKNEFNTFFEDFEQRFPSTAEWMERHISTTSLWFDEVFSNLELSDCLEVSRMATRGDIRVWEAYERERIPAVYRRHAGHFASARRERQRHKEWKTESRQANPPSLVKMVQERLTRKIAN